MPIGQPPPAAQEGGVGLKGHGAMYLPVLYRDSQFIDKTETKKTKLRGETWFLFILFLN